jgi:fibronectin-binding autotransporter adhesin
MELLRHHKMMNSKGKPARRCGGNPSLAQLAGLLGALIFFMPSLSRGADIEKANNYDDLSDGSSWVGGVAPGPADYAVFDSIFNEQVQVYDDGINNWLGLIVTDPGLTPYPTAPISLGSGGVDLSVATQNFGINGTITLTATQSWNITAGRAFTVSGLGGPSNLTLTKTGAGDMVVNRTSYFTGQVVIAQGRLIASSQYALQSVTVNYDNQGGQLSLSGVYGDEVDIGGLAGAQNLSFDGLAKLSLGGTLGTAIIDSTYSGVLSSSSGALFKDGNGTVTLTGANTFVGGVIIDSGTLVFSNLTNLGVSNTVALNGGTLKYAAGNSFDLSTISLLTSYAGGTIDTNGNDVTFATPLPTTAYGTNGIGPLTKAGNGTLTLAAPNAIPEGLTLTGGIIRLADPLALASCDFNYQIGGGTLSFGTLTNATIYLLNGNENLALTNDNGVPVQLTVTGYGNYSGNLSGAGASLTINAWGMPDIYGLTLSGNNTYTGVTTLNGAVTFSSLNNFGTSNNLIFNGGILAYAANNSVDASVLTLTFNAGGGGINTNGNDVTFANAIGNNGTGGFTKYGDGNLTLMAPSTYGGSTLITGGALVIGVDGAIPATSAVNITVTSNSIGLGYNGGVTGNITVTSNSIGLGYSGGVTGGFGGGNLILDLSPDDDSPSFGLFLNDIDTTLASLTGNGGIALGNATLTVGGDNTSMTYSGSISGNGGLIKNGSGSFTLLAANSYSGTTQINSGTLILSGSGSISSGSVNIAAGASFGGSGPVGGSVVVSGQLLPGGSSGGGLSVAGDLTFNSGAALVLPVGGAQANVLQVSGNLTLAGNVTLAAPTGYLPPAGATFNLFQAGGTVSGAFSNIILPALAPGLSWDTSNFSATGNISIKASFAAWTAALGLSGTNAEPGASPFSDPLPNLLRYAMNVDPVPGAGQLPSNSAATIGDVLCVTLQYRERKGLTDVQLVPQSSPDLVNWANVVSADITQLADDDTATSRYQVSVAAPTQGVLFLRIVAQPTP